ncbi:Retrovirus-related Pol polyprotein like [Argiope bruennichi]|uniref:Retrovirus-related Pol polyprotein like n=1 Tax=Argiope bruennichi TaxID=94029 RepID=A0A8T0F3A3_ARGBR|nr:Retrovirus-related Pol polyprotein like [Argiope bruennichi]
MLSMNDAGEINFRIRPLDDSNFPQWSKEIKVILLERNLWEIVTEKKVEPDIKDVKLVNDLKIRRNKAFATIFMNFSNGLRPIIENVEDPVLAWKKLKDYFQPDSRARTMALKNEFYNLRPEPHEKIAIYGSKLERIAEQLQECGHPIDEQDRCFQILRSLPDEMENVIQNIYRWEEKDFKFFKVLDELIREEGRLHQRKADRPTATYATTTRKKGYKENLVCFHCNRKGHFKRVCPLRKKEQEKQPRTERRKKE